MAIEVLELSNHNYRSDTKGLLMNLGWRPKRSFIGQINDFWTFVTNVFPQNWTFWRQKKLRVVARVLVLHMCACNIKTKKNGNWLGPVMDLFGRLLDLSLENNAFPTALMDLFQKISSRLIKLIVTAHPNLSWHYGTSGRMVTWLQLSDYPVGLFRGLYIVKPVVTPNFNPRIFS